MVKKFALICALLGIVLLQWGCKDKEEPVVCTPETPVACATDSLLPNVRVHNASAFDYCNLKANICCGEENYGSLAAGAYTCYRAYPQAWEYASFSFSIDGRPFSMQIIDHVGDTALAPGLYTYELFVPDAAGTIVSQSFTRD